MRTVERSRDRREVARDAGLRTTSLVSVLAGGLVTCAAVLVLLAVASGIARALDLDAAGLGDDRWQDLGPGAAVALGLVLLIGTAFGGYVAGRMGRRSGVAHGLLVLALVLAVIGAVAAFSAATADGDATRDQLRDRGIPAAPDDWRDIGPVAGAGLLAAMLAGAVAGGARGERWHGVLVSRALDPGPRGATPQDRLPRRRTASPAEETMTIPPRGLGDDTVSVPALRDERTRAGRVSGTEDTVHLPRTGPVAETPPGSTGPTGPTRRPVDDERTRVTRLR